MFGRALILLKSRFLALVPPNLNRINRREPRKLRSDGAPLPCDTGVADPLEICSSLTCYPAECGHSIYRSNGAGVIKEILLKMTRRVPPFNVT